MRRILRRAADLHDTERLPSAGARPLTFEEIEHLARDAGIADGLVRRVVDAAEETPKVAPPGTRSNVLLGGPTHLSVERNVAGRVGPQNHARLVKAIRDTFGDAGNAQVLGDSLAWSMTQWGPNGRSGSGRRLSVSIDPDGDGVAIRIDENLRGLAGSVFGGIVGGVAGGSFGLIFPTILAAVHSAALALTASLLWAMLVYFAARAIYASRVRARTEELSKLVSSLAERVAGEETSSRDTRSRVAAGGPRVEHAVEADDPSREDEVERQPTRRGASR